MIDPHTYIDRAWTRLEEGAGRGRSPFSMMFLSTLGLEGTPETRTVVLRAVTREARLLRFNTDQRAPKVAEMEADPRVSLLGYDLSGGEQIRLGGMATVHRSGPACEAAWEGSAPWSRICYRHTFAPGTPLEDPAAADPTEAMKKPADTDAGREIFSTVLIEVTRVDFLDLASSGHRRVRFDWTESGWIGGWVAP